ncbi:hypothetical protein CEXT_359711 [Caerostris extrusa]|uniref:Uncharacterized protein n=1 Tax=Caerostris extrusa TaxID=172846 RepID=A0AAV4VJP2_CAEEX|nr:hypothetical protein CEXT_359711 [Caerostris extrusa]
MLFPQFDNVEILRSFISERREPPCTSEMKPCVAPPRSPAENPTKENEHGGKKKPESKREKNIYVHVQPSTQRTPTVRSTNP